MANPYFTDFRSYIGELEKRGKLHRWKRAVNKDTELMPLMRLQYRGVPDEQRKAFLFENVVDSRGRQHDIRVATGMYGSSREIAALGLGCDEPSEIFEKWRHALAKPFEPRRVSSSPVQDIVYTGETLKKFGVTRLPAPVEEPGFSGGIRATAPFITQDRETGVRNVGMYSGHFRGEDKLVAGIAPTHHAILYHHRERGLPFALGRYPGDRYFDGSAWYLCSFAAAEFEYRRASLAGDRAMIAHGDAILDAVRAFVPETGALSEQFHPETGVQLSACNLTWSYAAFITATHARAAALRL